MSSLLGLVIEDDPDVARIFSFALRANNLEVEIIPNGKDALARLKEATPHVIILDMHLPEVAGPDILQQIRSDERLANAKVLVATADPRMAESVEDRADLMLIKPIKFSQVRDLVERLTQIPD
jgi:CheY-like chemotaxis protein